LPKAGGDSQRWQDPMSQTDYNDDLEAQIREALARRRADAQPRQDGAAGGAPGLAVDPSERLSQPAQPRVRFVAPEQRPQPPAGAPQPVQQRRPPQMPQPAPAGQPAQLVARAADDGETRIPPPPGQSEPAGQALGRIDVEQKAAQEPPKPPRHPFFSGRRHLWPLLILPIVSLSIIVILFWVLNFELAGEGVVDLAPLIEAEEGPIKVRPDAEGGLEIPNQDMEIFKDLGGDSSTETDVEQLVPPPEEPIVPAPTATAAETETIPAEPAAEPGLPAVMAPDPSAPGSSEPAADTADIAPEPAPEPAAEEPAAAIPADAYRIQLAAVRTEAGARETWAEMQAKYPQLLSEMTLYIEQIDLGSDKGIYFRVQAGPLDSNTAANKLCGEVTARGQACLVVRP
jgi:hypothetical protein